MATPAAQAYRDGDTRSVNGVTYVRQGGRWIPSGTGTAPAPAQTIQIRPPDARVASQQAQAPIELERERVGLERDRVALEAARAERERTEQGRQAQEGERRAAFLATRLATAMREITEQARANPSAVRPSTGAEVVRYVAGDTPANFVNSPERQAVEAAQFNAIDAALTLGTGAAYTQEQIEGYRRSLFPAVGDTPQAIAAKRRQLEAMLTSARINAGAAAPQIDEALASLGALYDESTTTEGFVDDMLSPARNAAERAIRQVPSEVAVGNRRQAEEDDQILDIGRLGSGYVIDPTTGREVPLPPVPAPPAPGIAAQLGRSTLNTLAGVGEGLAAIPDAATNAAGAILAIPADLLGFEETADLLRQPYTIGGAIEDAVPMPEDFTGRAVRFASNLTGGAASLPRGAANALTTQIIGRAPPVAPSAFSTITPRQVAEDASALRIPLLPADTGGPTTRVLTSAFAQTPLGARPIVNAAQRSVQASQRALEGVAAREGAALTPEAAGEAATTGALRYRDLSRTEATRLYDRATQLAGDVRVQPQGAMQALDRHIAELSENPAGAEGLAALTSLRESLAAFPDGVTVGGIRGMRTQLRDRFFSAGLRGSDIERRVMEVVDEASNDVATALTTAGRGEAAETYRAADAAWAARADAIDNVIMPIIGRQGEKSGEEVFRALQGASKRNGSRLNQFLEALPEEDAGTVRASLINALGRPTSGGQNAAGDAFSLNRFLTHWNDLSPSARNALFPRESREAIESLARVAESSKAASAYANASRTGGVIMTGATGASVAGGWGTLASVLAGQMLAGRLLASPRYANLLARIGSARSPRAARSAIADLDRAGRRTPALASGITSLTARLEEAFGVSPATRAAADQNE